VLILAVLIALLVIKSIRLAGGSLDLIVEPINYACLLCTALLHIIKCLAGAVENTLIMLINHACVLLTAPVLMRDCLIQGEVWRRGIDIVTLI
jgi:hypothetical protein